MNQHGVADGQGPAKDYEEKELHANRKAFRSGQIKHAGRQRASAGDGSAKWYWRAPAIALEDSITTAGRSTAGAAERCGSGCGPIQKETRAHPGEAHIPKTYRVRKKAKMVDTRAEALAVPMIS